MITGRVGIINEYLRRAYFGRDFFGLDSAARGYFGLSRMELEIAESFFLVERLAIPNGFRSARLRNILLRPEIQLTLGQQIARLPSIYETHLDLNCNNSLREIVLNLGGGLDACRATA